MPKNLSNIGAYLMPVILGRDDSIVEARVQNLLEFSEDVFRRMHVHVEAVLLWVVWKPKSRFPAVYTIQQLSLRETTKKVLLTNGNHSESLFQRAVNFLVVENFFSQSIP